MSAPAIHLGVRRAACCRAGRIAKLTMSLSDVTCARCRDSLLARRLATTPPEVLTERVRRAERMLGLVGALADQHDIRWLQRGIRERPVIVYAPRGKEPRE